jgi:hypothetical protein
MANKQPKDNIGVGKGKGRPAGSVNKLGSTAKENIAAVFVRMGGTAEMTKWAKANPTQFYSLYAKLIPVEVSGEGGGPLILQLSNADAAL